METRTNNQSNLNIVLIAVGVIAALLCICGVLAFTGLFGMLLYGATASNPIPGPIEEPVLVPTDTQGPPLTLVASPPPPESAGVVEMLEQAEIPPRDRYDLATRLLGVENAVVEPVGQYEVGDRETFYVEEDVTEQAREVDAEMVYRNDVVYMWVEAGQDYDYNGLVRSADRFAEETYPTNRENFGSEPSPGIDGDPRLHILHFYEAGSDVAGYFYSPSEYPREVMPYSNEKEIFFINLSNTSPGTDWYDSVLAHEFQHMIQFNVDPNEPSWMDEGLSELATYLNGYGPSSASMFYLGNPDLQLNAWPEDDTTPNYGAGFMWNAYFLDRFGVDAMRAVVAHQENGLEGIEAALSDMGQSLTADDVFADWVIANYLNNQDVAPQYGYSDPQLNLGQPSIADSYRNYPVEDNGETVHQYGVDYIELDGTQTVRINFEGATQVQIIPTGTMDTDNDPSTADQFVWWSNRADDSDMMLTRTLDLTGVSSATLDYDVWYWIEDRWDFAYFEASTDGGQTWTIVPTAYTTTDDPHGSNYGSGYTGLSTDESAADSDGWLHESIDLSQYAGQQIMIRFEYVTDDAVNQPGLAVDNICVPELNWCDNAEAQDAGWDARGFVRHTNVLPQTFIVQVIVPDGNGSYTVQRMDLNDTNQGEITVTLDRFDPAVLVISGTTRFTTELAIYRYKIEVAE